MEKNKLPERPRRFFISNTELPAHLQGKFIGN